MSEGIGNQPEAWSDFLNRMVPIVNQRGDWRGQGVYYATNALTVGANEGERVQTCGNILKSYPGLELHGMGHSNGTRVILDGWQAAGRPPIATIHLLCGACDADCDSNGINDGLLSGLIGDVFVYVATQDEAMRIENTLAGKALFQLPLGHQPLGLAGPQNVNPAVMSRIHVIDWTGFGHSTCWDDQHFDATVAQILDMAESPRTPIIAQPSVLTPDLSPRAQGEQIRHL